VKQVKVAGGVTDTTTYSYNGDNQMTQSVDSAAGTTTFGYDANGSQTSITNGSSVTVYGYDLRNRLTSVTVNGVVQATYGYDNAGNRVSETAGGTTTYYLIDAHNPTGYPKPIEQWTSTTGNRSTATLSISYIIGDRVLAQANSSGAVSYLLVDGQDNTRALINSSGAVTAVFNYDAFGNPIGSWSLTTAPTTILFQQTMVDPASGLNFDGGREEKIGQDSFIEADPPGYSSNQNPITLNAYLLDGADAINMVDPSGHDFSLAELVIDAGISSVLGAIASPVIMPAAAYVIGGIANVLLDPGTLSNMVNAIDAAPPALMLGADIMGGVGYSTASVTGGVSFEALLSTDVHQGYWADNISLSVGGSGSYLRGSAAAKAGVVFGVSEAGKYDGPFNSVTLPIGSIPSVLLTKLSQWSGNFAGVLAGGLGELPSLGLAAERWAPVFQEAFEQVTTLSGDLSWLGGLASKLQGKTYVTLFWAPDGKDWGFDFAYGAGNSGSYNYTRSDYHEL
jgi:YD repeat-containing protein